MNKIIILSHADLPGALRHKTIESLSIKKGRNSSSSALKYHFDFEAVNKL